PFFVGSFQTILVFCHIAPLTTSKHLLHRNRLSSEMSVIIRQLSKVDILLIWKNPTFAVAVFPLNKKLIKTRQCWK
uniref:Uncharacterized protein n=1 Tax=Cyprinodon variegatus TaxID=28743 RepID=A0A3Q2EIS3_CYPVA